MTEQPYIYTPDQRNSYYSPGIGTTGVDYTPFETPKFYGEPFPSGFLGQAQFNRTVSRYDSKGSLIWKREGGAGPFVTLNDNKIFVMGPGENEVDVLSMDGDFIERLAFDRAINYVKVFGDKLVVVYNVPSKGVDVFHWNGVNVGPLRFSTEAIDYGRAAAINGDLIAITDTFGGKIIIQNMVSGAVVDRIPVFYPNDVQWVGAFLYYVEEHLDRIVAYHLPTGKRQVIMAPPNPILWDASNGREEKATCGDRDPPRSKSTDACSGMFTLYAPNGLYVTASGMFVADTDNSRVLFVRDGAVRSVLVGFNNPGKIVGL